MFAEADRASTPAHALEEFTRVTSHHYRRLMTRCLMITAIL